MGWLTGWSHRCRLRVDGAVAGLSGSVSGGIVIEQVPAELAAYMQAAGQDLRITADDGETLLPYGIESWTSRTVQTRLPAVSAGLTDIYLYGGNPLAADAQRKDLVAADHSLYLPFGDAGPSYAYDWSVGNNTATQSGGVLFGQTGRVGGCCYFDGVNDYFTIPGSPSLNGWTAQTVSAWIKIPGLQQRYPRIIEKGVFNEWTALVNFVPDTGLVRWTCGPSGQVFSTSRVDDDSWHHFCGVITPTYMTRIYIDGVQQGGDVQGGVPASKDGQVVIGISADFSRELKGLIDEVRIAPAVLSADAIRLAAKSYPGSALYSFGAVESAPVTFAPWLVRRGRILGGGLS